MLAAGRKARYFWLRVLVGASLLGLLVLIHSSRQAFSDERELSIAAIAGITAAFYTWFAWVTMGAVLAITPVIAAGAIATERERRTIEYLFTTDLSNAEIVLDKLLARLLTVGKIVLAALPVLAIFRLLGGVPADLLLAHSALFATTAMMVASYALLAGVYCERARDAAQRAISGVCLFLVSAGFVWGAISILAEFPSAVGDWVSEWVLAPLAWVLMLLNPIVAMFSGGGVLGSGLGVDFDPSAIYWTCAAQVGVSAVMLALAVAVVRRVHLASAGAPGGKSAKAGKRGKASAAASKTRSPYDRRPMLWKEMFAASNRPSRVGAIRRRIGVAIVVLLIGGALAGTVASSWAMGRTIDFDDYMGMAIGIATAVGSVIALAMGSRAAGLVSYERERDTWLSLLTTPLSGEEIVRGKVGGNFYAFRWALVGAVLIPLSGVFFDWWAAPAAAGFAVSLGLVCFAATSIGLAASLRVTSSIKAVGITIGVLFAISALYPALAGTFFGIAGAPEEAFLIFVLPAVAPMLLALPMAFMTYESPPGEMMVACVGGLIFYTVLGAAAYASNVNNFDRICGRGTESTPAAESRPRPAPPTAAPAEGAA